MGSHGVGRRWRSFTESADKESQQWFKLIRKFWSLKATSFCKQRIVQDFHKRTVHTREKFGAAGAPLSTALNFFAGSVFFTAFPFFLERYFELFKISFAFWAQKHQA